MVLEDCFDIEGDPPQSIRLRGTRIDLDDVIELYRLDLSPTQIAGSFASPIAIEQAYAAVTYYLLNPVAVDDCLQRRGLEADRLRRDHEARPPTTVGTRLRDLKQRLMDGGPFSDGELGSDSFRRLLEREAKDIADLNESETVRGVPERAV